MRGKPPFPQKTANGGTLLVTWVSVARTLNDPLELTIKIQGVHFRVWACADLPKLSPADHILITDSRDLVGTSRNGP